jgi:aspyridone synthetase trans-acting enoyl reductase
MSSHNQMALVAEGAGRYALADNADMPKVMPDRMVCNVAAIALNPADWKMIDFSATPGSVGGNDFAGEVVQVGHQVRRFKKGDRIFAMSFGLNPSDKSAGAFGQYAIATADLACRIPDWMPYEEASTLGVAIGTAGSALYQALDLPMPDSPARKSLHVLISGGATATGTIAIQLAKAQVHYASLRLRTRALTVQQIWAHPDCDLFIDQHRACQVARRRGGF